MGTQSIRSNVSTISNRSDKRAMFKAFLLSKSDQQPNEINASSKPDQFQRLLDELNNEMTDTSNNLSEYNPFCSKEDKVASYQSLNSNEDQIIEEQELSQLLQEIEISQKQFQEQLVSVEDGFKTISASKSVSNLQ